LQKTLLAGKGVTLAFSSGKRLPENGMQAFGCCPVRITQLDFVMLSSKVTILRLSPDRDLSDGSIFISIGANMEQLSSLSFIEQLKRHL